MKKPLVILIVLSVLAVLGLVLFSFKDTQKVEQGAAKVMLPETHRAEPAERPARKLVPARPEDYGMIVTDTAQRPTFQQQWDMLIRDKVNELKSQYPPETWDKVQQKIKEDPAVTAQKLRDINDSIKKCREILEKEPDNEEIKQKLERLMMLKSIGDEFPARE